MSSQNSKKQKRCGKVQNSDGVVKSTPYEKGKRKGLKNVSGKRWKLVWACLHKQSLRKIRKGDEFRIVVTDDHTATVVEEML